MQKPGLFFKFKTKRSEKKEKRRGRSSQLVLQTAAEMSACLLYGGEEQCRADPEDIKDIGVGKDRQRVVLTGVVCGFSLIPLLYFT